MMGRSHGMSGTAAGLAAATVVGATTTETLLLAAVTTLGAYVPDVDHRGSTITRAVPVLGSVASWLARGMSRQIYAATKGPRDEDHSGEHRHATHTAVFAALLGALVGVGVLSAGGSGRLAVLVGGAAALGCLVHDLGDALTLSGCPFLWPLPIAGETWYEIRPPRMLRFRTGGAVETLLVFPVLVVAVVLLLPGVWPVALEILRAVHP